MHYSLVIIKPYFSSWSLERQTIFHTAPGRLKRRRFSNCGLTCVRVGGGRVRLSEGSIISQRFAALQHRCRRWFYRNNINIRRCPLYEWSTCDSVSFYWPIQPLDGSNYIKLLLELHQLYQRHDNQPPATRSTLCDRLASTMMIPAPSAK